MARSTGSRLASGVAWTLIGAVISRGIIVSVAIVSARILGKTTFGQFVMVNSTVEMWSLVVGTGLGLTCTKYIAQLRSDDPARAGRIMGLTMLTGLILGALMASFLFAVAPWFAETVLKTPQLSLELRIAAIVLLTGTLAGLQNGALAGFESFRALAWVNVIHSLIIFPIRVSGVWFFGLRGAVIALIVGSTLRLVLGQVALRRQVAKHHIQIDWANVWRERGILWRFALPALLSSATFGPVMWLCNTFLVTTRGGFGELGVFNAANQWRNFLSLIPRMLASVVTPILAERYAQNDRAAVKKTLFAAIGGVLLISLMPAGILMLFSRQIMWLYGAGFEQGWLVLDLVVMAAVVFATIETLGKVFSAADRMWLVTCTSLLWAVVLLTLFLNFRQLGATGLAVSILAAYLVQLGGMLLLASNLMRGWRTHRGGGDS